jgi:hypothetical protein
LNGSHACAALNVQVGGAEDWTSLHVLDDGAPAQAQRRSACPMSLVDMLPVSDPPVREPALRRDLQLRGLRVQKLDGPEVRMRDGDRRVENRLEHCLDVGSGEPQHRELVQPALRRFSLSTLGDVADNDLYPAVRQSAARNLAGENRPVLAPEAPLAVDDTSVGEASDHLARARVFFGGEHVFRNEGLQFLQRGQNPARLRCTNGKSFGSRRRARSSVENW